MNPEIKVDTIKEKIKDENIGSIISPPGLIIDKLDNFDTRYVLISLQLNEKYPLSRRSLRV
jgi:adenylyltransferase/sulfurtransferase